MFFIARILRFLNSIIYSPLISHPISCHYNGHVKCLFAPPLIVTLFQKQKEHLAHELYLCEKLLGRGSMNSMTPKQYKRLRDKLIDFLRSKSDDIDLTKWSYANVYTVLSVFREYHKKLTYLLANNNLFLQIMRF